MSDERESLDRPQRVRFVREVTRQHMVNGAVVPVATAIEGRSSQRHPARTPSTQTRSPQPSHRQPRTT